MVSTVACPDQVSFFSESWLVASNLVWYGQRKLSCEWVVKHITSQICIKILHLDCSRKIRASSTWPLLCSMLIWWQTARSKYVKDIWTNMHKVANCLVKFVMKDVSLCCTVEPCAQRNLSLIWSGICFLRDKEMHGNLSFAVPRKSLRPFIWPAASSSKK